MTTTTASPGAARAVFDVPAAPSRARHRSAPAATPRVRARRSGSASRVALTLRRNATREALATLTLVASLLVAPHPAYTRGDGFAELGGGAAFVVPANASVQTITRDLVTSVPGSQTLAQVGTNEAWARLVLLDGGWPQSADNVTVLLRWMRQENGTNNWWNRNNPLNNGLGTVGAGGTGRYPNLIVSAHFVAANLQRPIFSDIAAALAANQSASATASVIWASRWSTSHYANGTHWSTRDVDVVQAPASAWGL